MNLMKMVHFFDVEESLKTNEFWVQLGIEWGADPVDLEAEDEDTTITEGCFLKKFPRVMRSMSNLTDSPFGLEQFRRTMKKSFEKCQGSSDAKKVSEAMLFAFLRQSMENLWKSSSTGSTDTDYAKMSREALEDVYDTIDRMFQFVDKMPTDFVDRSVSFDGLSFDDSEEARSSPTTSEDEGICIEKLVKIHDNYYSGHRKKRDPLPDDFRGSAESGIVKSTESLDSPTFKELKAFWEKLSGGDPAPTSEIDPEDVMIKQISIKVKTTPINSINNEGTEEVFACDAFIIDESYNHFIDALDKSHAADTSTLNRSKKVEVPVVIQKVPVPLEAVPVMIAEDPVTTEENIESSTNDDTLTYYDSCFDSEDSFKSCDNTYTLETFDDDTYTIVTYEPEDTTFVIYEDEESDREDIGIIGKLNIYDNCMPPENDLQKNSDRVLSEHELRVQRSLQKLNIPDWYKNAPAPREGFLLRKRLSDAASSPSANRWPALSGKTTSLGSLGGGPPLPVPVPQLSPANTTFGRWSTSRLNSSQTSPCSSTRSSIRGTVSPLCSPSTRSSFSTRTPYLGWRSQERLSGRPRTPHERLAISLLPQNSTQSKASEEIQSSIKEVTSAIVHYVSGLEPHSDDHRAPSPRGSQKLCWVESSFVGTKPLESPQTPSVPLTLPPAHPRPPSSLRLELHHRQGNANENGERSSDWDSSQHSLVTLGLTRPSPGSTTLEDVLDSLLGLPASARAPTPQASPRRGQNPYNTIAYRATKYSDSSGQPASLPTHASTPPHERPTNAAEMRSGELERSHRRKSSADSSSCSTLPPGMDTADSESPSALLSSASKSHHRRQKSTSSSRRQSEPSASQRSQSLDRRVSFDVSLANSDRSISKTSLSDLRESKTSLKSITSINTDNSGEEPTVRCRYSKCNSKTTVSDAKRHYKNCHNCNYTYCSRECRRAHWEKHRKVCLHSRASALCRQILSTAKEDQDSLHHISSIGYKNYLTAGRGVVKVFFTSPESAERFISGGFQHLNEPNYVRWPDLEPNEMGPELYAELVKLCKSYNPETKVILYVAVCIVSEVPTKGAVKWERQLVSRCAKLRLSKAVSTRIQRNLPFHPSPRTANHRKTDSESTSESAATEALILTSTAVSPSKRTAQKIREVSFANIQKQLQIRGVDLQKHFPEVHAKLCAYVDGTCDKFAPVTVYPRDSLSGKSFMCVIMPDTEPDKFDMLPEDSSSYLKIDVSVDDANDHQMSTPM